VVVVVDVPVFVLVVVTEDDAGRVVWLEHPAATTTRAMAAIWERRQDLTFR
jgi:hypothetical protein